MRKSDDKRQQLLEVAYRLFSSKGFDNISISRVAAEVGVSKVTIYNYFSSKEDLFVQCVSGVAENYLEDLFAGLDPRGATLSNSLNRLGKRALHLICSSEVVAAYRLAIAEECRHPFSILFYERIASRQAELAAYLAGAMAAGSLHRGDPRLAAAQFRALLEAEVYEPVLLKACAVPPGKQSLRQAAGRAVDTFLRAYAPTKP